MSRYIFIGLGNPGEEYKQSRHNVGRQIIEDFVDKQNDFSEWQNDKKSQSLKSSGLIGKTKVDIFLPETFMNRSGKTAGAVIRSIKEAHNLVVLYDDIDLPLGTFKINYNRGSGGHKGLESIIKALRTKEFIRVRVGIAPRTAKGLAKKPQSEKVIDFVIANFKPTEKEILKTEIKKIHQVLLDLVMEGLSVTMNRYN